MCELACYQSSFVSTQKTRHCTTEPGRHHKENKQQMLISTLLACASVSARASNALRLRNVSHHLIKWRRLVHILLRCRLSKERWISPISLEPVARFLHWGAPLLPNLMHWLNIGKTTVRSLKNPWSFDVSEYIYFSMYTKHDRILWFWTHTNTLMFD